MKHALMAFGVVLGGIAMQSASGALIKNGGFEDGETNWVFQAGQPQGVVSDAAAFAHTPENGSYYAYSNNGTVTQMVTDASNNPVVLEAGVTYTLSGQVGFPATWGQGQFDAYANVGRSLRLLVVDDSSAEVHLIAISPEWFTDLSQGGQWFDINGEFTADASNACLGKQLYVQFYTAGIQGSWDNIELTAVPEPASLGALGVGGALLLARRRH